MRGEDSAITTVKNTMYSYKPAEASSVDQCEEEVHEIIKKLKIFEREGEDLCLIIGD